MNNNKTKENFFEEPEGDDVVVIDSIGEPWDNKKNEDKEDGRKDKKTK